MVRSTMAVCIAMISGCHGAAKPPPPVIALIQTDAGASYASATAQARNGLVTCARQSRARIVVPQNGDPERQATLFATEDVDTIVGVGSPAAPAIAEAARRFDARHFVSIGVVVPQPNVESILFNDREAAYVAGAMAATASASGRVALLSTGSPASQPGIQRAFARGAASVRSGTAVHAIDLSGSQDAAGAKRAVTQLASQQYDVIYAPGVENHAVDAAGAMPGVSFIVDGVDLRTTDASGVVARIVRNIDAAALRACLETVAQKPASGIVSMGVAQGGITISVAGRASTRIGVERARRLARLAQAMNAAGAANASSL
jgi:basic membrane lipoprotein Med (substrate-binding protein (PBP1-ABC) superfamily)